MKKTLHRKLVEAFEQCDDDGCALHGCYASAAIRIFKNHKDAQRKKDFRMYEKCKENGCSDHDLKAMFPEYHKKRY